MDPHRDIPGPPYDFRATFNRWRILAPLFVIAAGLWTFYVTHTAWPLLLSIVAIVAVIALAGVAMNVVLLWPIRRLLVDHWRGNSDEPWWSITRLMPTDEDAALDEGGR